MAAFVWNDVFVTGIDPIDRQHHQLVDLINRLSNSLADGGSVGETELAGTFDALRDYAQFHFAEEEKIMSESGVDSGYQEAHRDAHAQFIEQIASMWNSRRAMSNPSETILGYLSPWLAQHILGTDQSLARQIELIKSGQSPAQALLMQAHKEDPKAAILLHAMNDLYHALSRQNFDLAAANRSLEQRVRERTQQLESANRALTDANGQLELFTRLDGLLGIANRKCFDERFAQEWLRSRREKTPLSLLMIDVDSFKRFNDSYGHPAGDRCLKAIAGTIVSLMHRPADLVARYGGEEFAVILPNTNLAGAVHKGTEIRERVAALAIPHRDSAAASYVTISVGAASTTPTLGVNAEALLSSADRALYQAKELGRNRVCTDAGSA